MLALFSTDVGSLPFIKTISGLAFLTSLFALTLGGVEVPALEIGMLSLIGVEQLATAEKLRLSSSKKGSNSNYWGKGVSSTQNWRASISRFMTKKWANYWMTWCSSSRRTLTYILKRKSGKLQKWQKAERNKSSGSLYTLAIFEANWWEKSIWALFFHWRSILLLSEHALLPVKNLPIELDTL